MTEAAEGITTGTWQLDAVHSKVGFSVEYLAGTFHGSFSPFEAALEVSGDGKTVLQGRARVEAVQVADGNLEAHLQTPDFFDAEQAPEISFTSSTFERSGDAVEVAGTLTIKGVSRPVVLAGTVGGPIVDPYGRERVNLSLAGTVDRSEFGLDWNVPLPSGEPALGRDVTLDAELALVKA